MIPGYWQVGGAVPSTPLELILNATMITKVVLAILALLSLLSWAIMLAAWWRMGRAERAAAAADREFGEMDEMVEVTGLRQAFLARGASHKILLRAMRFVSDVRKRKAGMGTR